MNAILEKDGTCLVEYVEVAESAPSRMLGLMGRRCLAGGHALLIRPCRSIHTFMMRFNLDLVFLGSDNTVVKIVRNVRPCRFVFGGRQARSVLEMASGWFPEGAVKIGDELSVRVTQ